MTHLNTNLSAFDHSHAYPYLYDFKLFLSSINQSINQSPHPTPPFSHLFSSPYFTSPIISEGCYLSVLHWLCPYPHLPGSSTFWLRLEFSQDACHYRFEIFHDPLSTKGPFHSSLKHPIVNNLHLVLVYSVVEVLHTLAVPLFSWTYFPAVPARDAVCSPSFESVCEGEFLK